MASENIFRKASIGDIDQIKKIETENSLSSWSVDDYVSELGVENSMFYVAETKRIVTGFIIARLIMNQLRNVDYKEKDLTLLEVNKIVLSEIEIYNIGVLENYKRRGVGSFLLGNLIKIAAENDVREIWLEVRVSNKPAIKFYESHGFVNVYTRKNFYVQPVEDAFVMSKKLGNV